MKRTLLLVLSMILCISLLIGCGSQPAPSTQSPKANEPVNTGTSTPTSTPSQEPTLDWPKGPITLVVHVDVGGGLDIFARAVQPYLQKELGVPIVIENVPGSSGRIGTTKVWNSKNDGYTFLMTQIPMTIVGDVLYDAEYEILEFEYIYSFDNAPYVIATKAGSEIDNLKELVELSKTRKLINSNSGFGGAMHFQSVIMKTELGIDYDELPFNSSTSALMGVVTGDSDFCILPYDVPLKSPDQYKVISVLSDKRIEQYPDVAVPSEEGYDVTGFYTRRGIIAPPDTDQAIIDRFAEAVEKAIEDEGFKKWLADNSIIFDPLGPDAFYKAAEEYYKVVEDYAHYFNDLIDK